MGIAGKKILLGVTGGIAAYKAVEIASRLTKAGAEVHVVMTRAAQEFVKELTFREITGQAVATSMWGRVQEFHVEHIALAQMADLALVAPATANFIAKAAVGMADDMLTTAVLATKAPVFVAPAMNTNMYENPVTQANLDVLRQRGFHVIEPGAGRLACGGSGKGRLPDPVSIVKEIEEYFGVSGHLRGRKILVTAGGTIEPIDPVRYIGNRSSGKMGYAAAAEAARRGADTVLVSAPTSLPKPAGVRCISIETAAEMREAVLGEYSDTDAVIMSAAVADYHVKHVSADKIKKSEGEWTLALERNPDILCELGQKKKPHQVLMGFAAETRDVSRYAKEKLERKNLDYIVANDVTKAGAGFQTETNIATIFSRDGEEESFPLMSKADLASILLDRVERALKQRNG